MNEAVKRIVEQLTIIIARYDRIEYGLQYKSIDERSEILTSIVAAIERYAPRSTFYFTSMQSMMEIVDSGDANSIRDVAGILKALKVDYESGGLQCVEDIIHADLFSDFLEMARYLLDENYKDASAVIIGGVLEEQLRKLCIKNDISIEVDTRPKKAEAMNNELYKFPVYSKLDNKNITAWLDLRNNAAHGKYSEYNNEQVNLMFHGVSEFVSRFPA